MSLSDQALSYVRAISPYQPGKPITQLSREMGIPDAGDRVVAQLMELAAKKSRQK